MLCSAAGAGYSTTGARIGAWASAVKPRVKACRTGSRHQFQSVHGPSYPCEIGVSQFQSSTEMGGLHSSGLAMKLGAFITDPAPCGDEILGPSWSTWRIIARLYDSDVALLRRRKAW
jgi:hypothetical protein